MRFVIPCPLLIALVFAHQAVASGGFARQQLEKDLMLQVTRTTPATIQVGDPIVVRTILRNQSATTAYPVAAPGDGSEVGWREPYVFYTATIDTGDGHPQPVPSAPYGRCGNYDSDWQKDARVLVPGEEMPLPDWFPTPSAMLEFQQAGHVELTGHYRFRAGTAARSPLDIVTGPLTGIPAFELVSAPVGFDVVRPLDLVLTTKAPLSINTKAKLSDLFDVRLVNRSKQPIEVSSPTLYADARLMFEIVGEYRGWRPMLDTQKSVYGEKLILKPGEEIAVLGGGTFANGMDGKWEYPTPDTIKVRAAFYLTTQRAPSPIILSDWVKIEAVGNKRRTP